MQPTKAQFHKIRSLQEHIQTSNEYIPFFVIVESHFKPYHLDAEINIDKYYPIRADRISRARGGAAIYMSNDLIVDNQKIYSDEYCSAVIVYNKVLNTIIAGIYRPPNSPVSSFRSCMETVKNFTKEFESSDVLLMGDFNLPCYNWKTDSIKPGYLQTEQDCAKVLIDFMEELFLTQLVDEPTRHDKNILDLIITNNQESIHSVSVEKTKLSDHDMINVKLLNENIPKTFKVNNIHHPEHILDELNLQKAKWENICEEFRNVNWDQLLNENHVEEMCKTLENEIVRVCSKHCVKRNTNKKGLSHIPYGRRSLHRIKKHTNAQINKLKYCSGFQTTTILNKIQKLEDKKVNLENQIKESIQCERQQKERKMIENIKYNPRSFYTFAKQKRKVKCKVGPLKDQKGELHSDPKKMADILQDAYVKVFSEPSPSSDTAVDPPDAPHILTDITFTEKDIVDSINTIPTHSAAGPDKMPSMILKNCKEELAKPLYKIWRKSLNTGEIPQLYKVQSIVPIFKKGSKASPSNYRPVSLTSQVIKVFERVLRIKIVEYLEENNILTKHQYGFLSGRGTLSQLLSHLENIYNILESGGNADVLYLDFSRAFDKVDHAILIKKLQGIGISGNVLEWIKQFLNNRFQKVIIEGKQSESERVVSGVPQGTVLGPTLFLIYINDIAAVIEHSLIMMFADDSKIIKSIKNPMDRELLMKDLQAVLQWAKENKMELNEDKFQLLSIGKLEDLKLPYALGDINIEQDSEVKDLGVTIDVNLNWSKHIANISKAARNSASWILRTISDRSRDIMLVLYKSFVRSQLEYSSSLWSPYLIKDITAIEGIQRSFTNRIDGMQNLNYNERLKELHLYSLQRRRERYIILQMWKIYKEMTPNDVGLQFYSTIRKGFKCRRPLHKSRQRHLNTLRFHSFTSLGPALFNLLPVSVKEASTLSTFKTRLDRFLKKFPDTPPTRGYVNANSNSLVDWAITGLDIDQTLPENTTDVRLATGGDVSACSA